MQSTERFEQVPIDKLIPYSRNARTHSKEQILQLRSSLREFGFVNPILSDADFNIIAGHGRILAAKAEGFTEVPCVFVEHLTEAQKRAYTLADNRTALSAGWDDEMLGIEMSELKDLGFDLALTGFDNAEIEKLFGSNDVTDDDFDVDKALEEPPFVQSGDLWTLGRHRLLCGDATKSEDVSRLMDGKRANLVLTDPPYLISYDKGKAGTIMNDNLDDKAGYEFILAAFRQAESAMASDASIYVFHADTKGELFRRAFREAGFHLSMCCIWKKNTFTLGRTPYQFGHEPCLFGWKDSGKHFWNSDRKQNSVWEFDKPHRSEIHSTMKPVPLFGYLIGNSTMTSGVVLDLFSGSFTTGIACQQLDRVCYAMELDPKYASASILRFRESFPDEIISVERNGEVINFADIAKGAAQ
ncbi:methyltransferase [Clostridia bacterium]|nr:methyltransferase [Clostridia bacterium]